MSRFLYRCALWFAFFLIPIYLLRRARKQPAYRQHWSERLGFYRQPVPTKPCLWIHGVSVGETRAARPLIKALQQHYPDHQIILTQMTPTGRETAQTLYPDLTAVYLPYDYPSAIRRFLAHFRPRLGLLIDTEIWPNLIHLCADQRIPLCLINARLSEKSLNGYLKVQSLVAPAVARLTLIAAQTREDAVRLQRIGGREVKVCGNIKFDQTVPADKVQQGKNWKQVIARPILLFASSRETEEAMLLAAIRNNPLPAATLLVIVPRHPQRFDEVARLCIEAGFSTIRRSQWQAGSLPADTQVLVGDSMGEMASYYACADIALIGGSFAPLGGQNLIEAAALGVPTIVGPHMFNFTEATQLAVTAHASIRVNSIGSALSQASRLLQDTPDQISMQTAAVQFARSHQGATQRILTLIQPILSRQIIEP